MKPDSQSLQSHHIMIVDDHPVVRAGIAAVLGNEPDLVVCAEVSSEAEALKAACHPAPDLAIVDLSLSTSSGLTLFRKLDQRFSNIRILVLSMHDESVYAEKCLQAGAHGYLMKDQATGMLVEAVRTLLDGNLYVSQQMRNMFLREMASSHNGTHHNHHPAPMEDAMDVGNHHHGPSCLTRSEVVILELIGMGHDIREIATRLNRSAKTISAHRDNIRQKLDLPNSNALLRYAVQWVQQNPPPPSN